MQEQRPPRSLIVKFKIPHGFSFDNPSSLSTTAAVTSPAPQQSAAIQPSTESEPVESAMASSSVAQAAAKKKFNMPSMQYCSLFYVSLNWIHLTTSSEPQTVVKIVLIQIEFPITKVFTIHKSFVCHYSPVFKKIFEDPLNETHSLRLGRSQIAAFSHLVHWLYYQTIQGEDGTTLTSLQLFWLRNLAVRFDIISLENIVIDKLHEFLAGDNWSVNYYSILKSAFHPVTNHPWHAARKMLVDVLAATRDMAKFDECISATIGTGVLRKLSKHSRSTTSRDWSQDSDQHPTTTFRFQQ
ncbi:hypothetical protein DL95DRAFT_413204 [Leptodontidium sp. 2 PMI_412]|nr:hypothetical protein DL95DRAFT_413204 [Leptodontidium sp. 2 PMI_412]